MRVGATSHRQSSRSRPRTHCELGHLRLRYRVAPCPASASTPCWRSAGCSRRARARPRRCWPAQVHLGAGRRAGGEAGPARRRRRRARGRRARRRTSRAAASSSPTRSTRSALDVAGRRALDVGASTGGFTDCLLQRGAAHVVALDVAYGELDWRLRERPARDRDRARQRARARRRRSSRTAPDLIVIDVSFISLREGAAGRARRAPPPRFDCLAMVKPQFEVGRERVGKGGVVRDPALRREAARGGRRRRASAGRRGARLRAVRPARARGQPRDVRVARRGRPRGRAADVEAALRGGRRMSRPPPCSPTAASTDTAGALRELIAAARARRRDAALRPRTRPPSTGCGRRDGVELRRRSRSTTSTSASSLGGDGTILTALRHYAGTGVPVFAVNFGEVGFLATVDPDGLARRTSTARSRATSRRSSCRRSRSGAPTAAGPRSTTSPSTASRACASPTSRTRSRGRRSAACAATAWWSPRRRARRATTSPTAARCWPGAWRASSSRSSRRTR